MNMSKPVLLATLWLGATIVLVSKPAGGCYLILWHQSICLTVRRGCRCFSVVPLRPKRSTDQCLGYTIPRIHLAAFERAEIFTDIDIAWSGTCLLYRPWSRCWVVMHRLRARDLARYGLSHNARLSAGKSSWLAGRSGP